MNGVSKPRFLARALAERLTAMPAVVLSGARQTGKSTLVGALAPRGRTFRTLDDLDVLERARRHPDSLVTGPGPMILAEVEREPALLNAIQRAIDRDPRPGRFLLTSSANLQLVRGVGESLAGRASHLTLWPMTRREQLGLGRCGLWEELIAADEEDWIDILDSPEPGPEDWRALARRGGFPTPAVHMSADEQQWFEGYVRTYLERDLQVLSPISALSDFRRLMRAASLRLGQLVNQAELARDVAMPQPTVHRWLNLLETSCLLVRLPAHAVSHTKRLIKTPRLYWGDVGLAFHLSGLPEPTGAHLENLVLHDLLAWRDGRIERAEVSYWRTAAGEEVDFVVEARGRVLPIEVDSTNQPRPHGVAALRSFRGEYGATARAGLLLHAGTRFEWLTSDVLAVPWWRVV